MYRWLVVVVILFSVAAWTEGFPWWKPKKSTYEILSYNVGLLPHVSGYDVRRLQTPQAVSDIDADVVCLQEVWYETDVRNILATADAAQYPYVVSELHTSDGELPPADPTSTPPCYNNEFLTVFQPCMSTNCPIVGNDQLLVACGIANCNMFTTISQECATCIVVTGSEKVVETCVGVPGNQINVPGLVLLSKVPLNNVRIEPFGDPSIVALFPRAYITAEVENLGTIVCTHLTSGGIPQYVENPVLGYTSWAEQNLAEAHQLVEEFDEERKVLLIGDLNSGPDVPFNSVDSELVETYKYLGEQGYWPTHFLTGSVCTYCMSNSLTDQQGSNVIDHFMTKRIWIESLTMVLDENLDGETFPLSDHHGLLAEIKIKPTCQGWWCGWF